MVETAAHLADDVFPRRPVRQWVLSVPKRLRYHLEHDPAIETLAVRVFLSVVEQRCLVEVDTWFWHAFNINLKLQSVCDGIRSGPPEHQTQTV